MDFCHTDDGSKWYMESDLYCCPCSECRYPDLVRQHQREACFGNNDLICETDFREYCWNKEDFANRNSIGSNTTTTTITIAQSTYTSISTTPNIELSSSSPYLAITAIASLLILLVLTIFVCKKRKLPMRAKAFILRCQKSQNPSKKNPDSIESDSFVSAPSETISEENSAPEDSMPQDNTEKNPSKICESFSEHPVIDEEKGGRDDPAVSISLPPSYRDEPPSGQFHPSTSVQRQRSNSFLHSATGLGPRYLATPDLNNPYSNYPASYGYQSHPYYPHPSNHFDPIGPRHHGYATQSVPYPVPPMSFSPHNLPGANCSGAVIMNNVQVSGNLNITNGKQASGNADDQPSLPAAANATSSIQPSIFATSELRETPSCTEQPEAKPDCKVGQRAVHLVRNDYEDAIRRQGSTIQSQSDIQLTKYTSRPERSQGSLASEFGRLHMASEQDSRFSTLRTSDISETTPAKFFERTDATASSLSKLRSHDFESSAHAKMLHENEALSSPIQETSQRTIDSSTSHKTSLGNVDLYQSQTSSNACLPR